MNITEQDIRRVAELANLALTEEETKRMAHDISDIMVHIDKLNELDVTNVEPMTQVLYDAGETATLREDVERPSLSNADAVANAAVSAARCYQVPRVDER